MTTASSIAITELIVVIAIAAATIIERAVPYRWRSLARVVFFAAGVAMFVVYCALTLIVIGLS